MHTMIHEFVFKKYVTEIKGLPLEEQGMEAAPLSLISPRTSADEDSNMSFRKITPVFPVHQGRWETGHCVPTVLAMDSTPL